MSTAAATLHAPADRVFTADRVGWWALVGVVASLQLSIAAAQICLAVAVAAWLVRSRYAGALIIPATAWPLFFYALWTLVSAGLSRDPAVSVPDTKQLVLFLLVPVVFTFARGPRARTVATVALTVGAASAFIGVVQYGLLNYDNLGRRPQGTLSHWMTYSGTLMLVICGSAARLLFDQRDRAWAALVMPALVVALGAHLHPQRLGRRVRRRRRAVPVEGPPADRRAAAGRGRCSWRWRRRRSPAGSTRRST